MKGFLTTFIIAALLMNANGQTKRWVQLPAISAAKTQFPLYIDKLNAQKVEKGLELDSSIESKTRAIIMTYYFAECAGDTNETYFKITNVYLGTLVLHDSLVTTYLILLQHKPGKELNGKIIFFDNKTKSV